MTLSMTRPWKHPASGFYWFRKRVPDDLRRLIGRGEEKFSLGTRDPIEAKRLHALKLAEVEERWANLRAGQRSFKPDDIARESAASAGVLPPISLNETGMAQGGLSSISCASPYAGVDLSAPS